MIKSDNTNVNSNGIDFNCSLDSQRKQLYFSDNQLVYDKSPYIDLSRYFRNSEVIDYKKIIVKPDSLYTLDLSTDNIAFIAMLSETSFEYNLIDDNFIRYYAIRYEFELNISIEKISCNNVFFNYTLSLNRNNKLLQDVTWDNIETQLIDGEYRSSWNHMSHYTWKTFTDFGYNDHWVLPNFESSGKISCDIVGGKCDISKLIYMCVGCHEANVQLNLVFDIDELNVENSSLEYSNAVVNISGEHNGTLYGEFNTTSTLSEGYPSFNLIADYSTISALKYQICDSLTIQSFNKCKKFLFLEIFNSSDININIQLLLSE